LVVELVAESAVELAADSVVWVADSVAVLAVASD